MLINLHIQNYALIRQLDIDFNRGFTIITGETGAGKSILLGALSLLLGQRADSTILFDKSRKCVVEASFGIQGYGYESFFHDNDIDYEDTTIIRREISPAGTSRAFINDTPVNLSALKVLGLKLVDIHSQHQNLQLGNNMFQLMIVDTVARHNTLLASYQEKFNDYLDLQKKIEELSEQARKARTDLDYFRFQHEQLEHAKLVNGELEELENQALLLNNAGEIKRNLFLVIDALSEEASSILNRLKECMAALERIKGYYHPSDRFHDRLNSVYIELKDVAADLSAQAELVELDPRQQELVNERLDLLNNLLLKHAVQSVKDLIDLRDDFQAKIMEIDSFDDIINELKGRFLSVSEELENLATKITAGRIKAIPAIEKTISGMLKMLGIPNAKFRVLHEYLTEFTHHGRDKVEFMFSANKQTEVMEIARVASGGELSRLMLSIKSLLSDTLELPTIIFDEVDSGVSGEIAEKVANIMKAMAASKQVINITHLPQIAGKGDFHYLVYKYDHEGAAITDIRMLDHEERVIEIAKMLSGEELTDAAISHARELIN